MSRHAVGHDGRDTGLTEGQFLQQDRRAFLSMLIGMPIAFGAQLPTAAAQTGAGQTSPRADQPVADFPDKAAFQSGDFIWSKTKGAGILKRDDQLGAQIIEPVSEEQREWEAERERYLQEPSKFGLSPQDVERLKSMSYGQFQALYFTSVSEQGYKSLQIGTLIRIEVGHVGIISIDAGIPHVVEAVKREGVIKKPYDRWLSEQSNVQVWHSRVRDLPAGMGQRIVAAAEAQIGQPYAFFNFDLNDDSGFYCSKLAWMSVWRAASIAVDDNPNPRRPFLGWFTPLALNRARRVEPLHRPGDYSGLPGQH